jgi:hypothetical protein
LPAIDLAPPARTLDEAAAVALVAGWCRALFAPDQVVEVRALDVPNGNYPPAAHTGFFMAGDGAGLAKAALDAPAGATGVYATLNPLAPALHARRRDRLQRAGKGDASTDADVLARRWLLVDVDPRRPGKVSATDAEKAAAGDVALAAREDLHARGWPEPVVADSGNGYHLLYRVDLPADDGGLVRRALAALARRFDTPAAAVDPAVFNPGRLGKVPGTLARKGDHTADRPHRRARLLAVPDHLEVVPRELIEVLAAEATPVAAPAAVARPAGRSRGTGRGGRGRTAGRLDVAAWLAARGVGFRVKDGAAAGGRTVYVLARCPFDPAHADPDACVMQAPDGKMSAHCFHASCVHRTWQAFKAAIGPPDAGHFHPAEPPAPPPPDAGLDGTSPDGGPRRIVVNGRQLPDVTAAALAALADVNDPPALFRFGGALARVRPADDDGPARAEPLARDALRGVLARSACWVEVHATAAGPEDLDVAPPLDVVRDVAALPAWPNVPPLRGVVAAPAFDAAGRLVAAPGYDPPSGLWLAPAPGLDVPPVPAEPTDADVAAARGLIVDDLLGDFPFADQASRAHAVACLVLPFARALVDGPTPLHLIDAPTEGTGKTLLAKAVLWVALGRDAPPVPEAESDAEWRKRITAELVEGGPVLFLDNLNRPLDAGSLAAALTTETWSDRLLGLSKMVRVRNRAVWVGTGNNVALSRELARRTLLCRLDAGVERPAERAGFRHPRLLAWVKGNRGRLVGAVLTLVRAWLARGRPAGTQAMGMYEAWAEVVGGILGVAGVHGLLGNRAAFREAQAAADDWPAFLHAWRAAHGDRAVGVADLYRLAAGKALLDAVLGDGGERSQRTRLGAALKKWADRVQGGVRVRAAGRDHSGRQLFRLEPAEPAATAEPAAAAIGV